MIYFISSVSPVFEDRFSSLLGFNVTVTEVHISAPDSFSLHCQIHTPTLLAIVSYSNTVRFILLHSLVCITDS